MYLSLSSNKNGLRSFVGPRRRRDTSFTLKLTSMIDMFTILLVFLLKSFSAEGQIMTVAKDLRLPESTAQKPPQVTSIVVITTDWVLIDGRPVAKVADILSEDNLVIKELLTELRNLRALTERIGDISADMSFTGNISIQGDKELPYQIIKKVMFTCGRVGYNNILLAVSQIE